MSDIATMKLIVGIGNPGEKFYNYRNNIGFKVVDIFANNVDIPLTTKKKKSYIGRGKINNQSIVILKPQTFVNLVGEAVLHIASYIRCKVSDIICVAEDPELNFGEINVVLGGSNRGHEGVESIERYLKNNKFIRMWIGVGPIPDGFTREKFLHQEFQEDEAFELINVLNKANNILEEFFYRPKEEVIMKYAGVLV